MNHYDMTKRHRPDWCASIEILTKLDPDSASSRELLSMLCGSLETTSITAQQALVFAMVEYHRAGQNAVRVGHDMQQAFMHTSLAGMGHDDIMMPYDAFWLELPDNECLSIWDGEHMVLLTGAYVVRHVDHLMLCCLSANEAAFWFGLPASDDIEGTLNETLADPQSNCDADGYVELSGKSEQQWQAQQSLSIAWGRYLPVVDCGTELAGSPTWAV